MIGIYSATCRKCTLLRHTATALFNNDNNCKGLIWESYLIWAKQPMIPSNGHQNYVVQRFMAKFFIAVEIHRKNSIWIFAPKIDKILLFWREFHIFLFSIFPPNSKYLNFRAKIILWYRWNVVNFWRENSNIWIISGNSQNKENIFFCSIQIFFLFRI